MPKKSALEASEPRQMALNAEKIGIEGARAGGLRALNAEKFGIGGV